MDLENWEEELKHLSSLLPQEGMRDSLKNREIPALEQEIKSNESSLPQAVKAKEEASVVACKPREYPFYNIPSFSLLRRKKRTTL